VSLRPPLGWRIPALLVAIVAVVAAAMVVPSSGHSPPANVHSAVLDERYHDDDGYVAVIIQSNGDTDAARAAVEAAGGVVSRQFTIIPALEARVPVDAVQELAGHAAVRQVSLNAGVIPTDGDGDSEGTELDEAVVEFLKPLRKDPGADRRTLLGETTPKGKARQGYGDLASVFPAAIGATDVWDEGITGKGIGIAIVDTGVNDGKTADFGSRVVAHYAVDGLAEGTYDVYGHGTHVAGIAAGDGAHSVEDGVARFMGIAPGANIISVKVGGFATGPLIGDVIEGLEWVLANRATYNIRVANLSFTSSAPESYLTNPLDAAVEQLWFNGIVVVVAAGNRGTGDFAVDHPPANDPFVVTVGAFSDNETVDPSDDYVKDWSSRGVTHEGFEKPEIFAPGSRLIATTGDGESLLHALYPENKVGPHYFRMGGTSAAAPVVSGVVALMLEANPALTPDQVKARIVERSTSLSGSSAPRVSAYKAVFESDAGLANQGIQRSLWIDPNTGSMMNTPAPLSAITWDAITWDAITWDAITWDAITWDAITWDAITWDAITWDAITWDSIIWD
jgi:serine protease AprX